MRSAPCGSCAGGRRNSGSIPTASASVLGFSAGGHLAGTTATDAEQDLYDDLDDEADGLNARPSFAGLIYPIITMRAPYDRTIASRKVLVGDDPPDARRRAYSVRCR